MILERAVPATAVRPRWSSASFLFYAATVVLVFATVALLAALAATTGGGPGSLTGWSALVLAVALAVALLLRGWGLHLPAGLAAFLAVVFVGTLVGALTDWVGIAPKTSFLQRSFEPGAYLVELAVVAASLAALRVFRFPLLVLPVVAVLLYALVDLGTAIVGGDSGQGVPAMFAAVVGGALAAIGVLLDRSGRAAYGMWPHIVGGIGIGEAILTLRQHGEGGWALVAVGALALVAASGVLGRSSYAVLGAIGVVVVSTHWIGKWVGLGGIVPFFGGGGTPKPWQIALAYVGVGAVLALLGLLVERRAFAFGSPAHEETQLL